MSATDGVVEALTPAGEESGDERLVADVRRTAHLPQVGPARVTVVETPTGGHARHKVGRWWCRIAAR